MVQVIDKIITIKIMWYNIKVFNIGKNINQIDNKIY